MPDRLPSLILAVSRFLEGEFSVRDLESVVAPLGEELPGDNVRLNVVWGRVELALAEYSSGAIDEADVRAELLDLAPVPVAVGIARSYDESGTSSHLSREKIATTAWLRDLRDVRTRAAAALA